MNSRVTSALNIAAAFFRKSHMAVVPPAPITLKMLKEAEQRAKEVANAKFDRKLTSEEHKALDNALEAHNEGKKFSKY